MIEVYLFYVVFAVQIVLQSVLIPNRLLRRIREGLVRYPAREFPQLYPGGEEETLRKLGRYLRWYVLLNGAITVAGLVLLGRLFVYMQSADWDDGPVETAIAVYFVLQMVPMLLFAFVAARSNSYLKNVMQGEKRKAVLQRRGLFDFVSPAVVLLTALCYPAFVALVFYIQRDPFPGFAGGYVNIGWISFLYAWTGFWVYRFLYGRKSNPLLSNQDRLQEIAVGVRISVYSCLAGALFLMLNFSLVLLDRQSMEPLAMSCFFIICSWFGYQGIKPATGPTVLNGPSTSVASGS
jgi:hypothetical protein